ncbi:MAG: metallophosphoesterase [Candidatus Cloacimonetes bacterium]|nr:metallophosphoesterase [Candidatus Cloacimonadota bacterium]
MRAFFLIFICIYFGTSTFVILHTMDVLKPFKIRFLFLILYILLTFAIFLGRIWGNLFPLDVSAWLARLGYIWMGLLVYMFVWSVIWLILRFFSIGPDLAIHRILFFLGEIILCFTIFLVGYTNARNVQVIRHNIGTDKELNIRIVQISDNHLGFMNSEKQFRIIIEKINQLEPDLLLITGDFLENEHNYAIINDIGKSLTSLNISLGIWAILGNHEYISGIETSIDYMKSLGISILRDDSVMIGDSLLLIGQEDQTMQRWVNEPLKGLDDLLSSTIENDDLSVAEIAKNKFTILMTHQIKNHKLYEKKDIDLVLSGHTHFGQYFPFNIITKKLFDIAYGLEKRGGTYMYVSSGTGVWGPPMRLGSRSEIVVFDVKKGLDKL